MTQTRDLRSPLPGGEERDGGLLIRNARLIGVGTWTDSAVGTPCHYSADVLRKDATNWKDYSYWSRHRGGTPRSIVEKIGIVRNPHYENDAVVGDILLHGRTQESRDAINYILWARGAGIPVFSSVELVDEEAWNPSESRYEATSVTFTGAACVNLGACTTCALPSSSASALESVAAELDRSATAQKANFASLEARIERLRAARVAAELEDPAPSLVDREAGVITCLGAPLEGDEPDRSARDLADPPGIIVDRHGEVRAV